MPSSMLSTKTVSLKFRSWATAWRRSGAIAAPVDEHPERIATAPVRTDEHPDDVEDGHATPAPEQRHPLDPDDRDSVGDAAVDRHRERLLEGHPADRKILGGLRGGRPLGQARRQPHEPELVGDRIGQGVAPDLDPRACLDAGLLAELATNPVKRFLVRADAALWDLPRVGIQRVAVLADEQQPLGIVEDDHARCGVSGSGRPRRCPGRRPAG
jgi:hypothetical protein